MGQGKLDGVTRRVVGGSFLAGKAGCALSRCLTTESAQYCMLVNEWAWSRL